MARNYNAGTLCFVTISGYDTLKYGFRSRISDTRRKDLGQTVINGQVSLTGLTMGVNAPKPPRASKKFATGTESSFIDQTKISDAKKNGWNITRSKAKGITGAAGFSKVFYVKINGIKYAWRSATSPLEPTALLTLGDVKTATGSDSDLVFGAEWPKPPRFSAQVSTEDAGGTYSTFFDPSKISEMVASANVANVKGGLYEVAAFNEIYGIKLKPAANE